MGLSKSEVPFRGTETPGSRGNAGAGSINVLPNPRTAECLHLLPLINQVKELWAVGGCSTACLLSGSFEATPDKRGRKTMESPEATNKTSEHRAKSYELWLLNAVQEMLMLITPMSSKT